MYSALSTFNTTTEVPLSKAPNPQLLPEHRSINDCPLLRVCVHGVCVCSLLCVCTLDGLNAEHKFRVWVTILGRMSRHFHSLSYQYGQILSLSLFFLTLKVDHIQGLHFSIHSSKQKIIVSKILYSYLSFFTVHNAFITDLTGSILILDVLKFVTFKKKNQSCMNIF